MGRDALIEVTRLRELESEWRARAERHAKHGDCYRRGQGWGLVECADELAAALAPAVVPSQEQKDALQALVDEAQVLGIYTDDDAPPVVAPVAAPVQVDVNDGAFGEAAYCHHRHHLDQHSTDFYTCPHSICTAARQSPSLPLTGGREK